MKRARLGDLVLFDDVVMEVFGLSDGPAVHMRPVGGAPCPLCGIERQVHLLVSSPLFQNEVKPVQTLEES